MANSNITSFEQADALADNDLLVVLHGGKVMSLPGSVLEAYAADQSDRVWYGPEAPSVINYNVWFDTSESTTNPKIWMRNQDGEWKGIAGVGVQGQAIAKVERTSGTGAKGETDTYTMYLDDGSAVGTFDVSNGSDGDGQVNTVNGNEPDDGGNVDITAENIPISDEDTQTVKGKLEELDSDKIGKDGGSITGNLTVSGELNVNSLLARGGLAEVCEIIPITTFDRTDGYKYVSVYFSDASDGWYTCLLVAGDNIAMVNPKPSSDLSTSLKWFTPTNIVGSYQYKVQAALTTDGWRFKFCNLTYNEDGSFKEAADFSLSLIPLRKCKVTAVTYTET